MHRGLISLLSPVRQGSLLMTLRQNWTLLHLKHKFLHHNRSGRKGGGTGLLLRETISVSKIVAGEKTSFEFSEWSLNTNSFRARL